MTRCRSLFLVSRTLLARVAGDVAAEPEWFPLNGGLPGSDSTVFVLTANTNNGELYVGGAFTAVESANARGVARWDGSRWHPMGEGLLAETEPLGNVYALFVDHTGTLYAGGGFTNSRTFSVNTNTGFYRVREAW